MKFIKAGEGCERKKKKKAQILKEIELNLVKNEELLKDHKPKTNMVRSVLLEVVWQQCGRWGKEKGESCSKIRGQGFS